MVEASRKVMVYNNNVHGSTGYVSEGFRIRRVWETYGEPKQIPFEELQDVCYTYGGRKLFEGGYLLIKDNEVREELGLPIDKAYTLDKADVIALLKGPRNKLDQTLEWAPPKIKELIAEIAVQTQLSDWEKLNSIQETTGVDVKAQIVALQVERAEKARAAKAAKATTK